MKQQNSKGKKVKEQHLKQHILADTLRSLCSKSGKILENSWMPGSSDCLCMACTHTHTQHPETIISTPMRLQKNASISRKKETRKHFCVWQIKVKVLWWTHFHVCMHVKPWKWADSQNTMYKCHPLHNLSLKRPRRSHHLLSELFPWNTSIQPVNSLYNWHKIIWSLGSTRFLHQACCLYGAVVKGNHLTDIKS